MPYILLIAGILIGLYALYRFFMVADAHQIKALFLTGLLIVIGVGVFALAITGRLPAALALIGAMIPIVIGMQRHQKGSKKRQGTSVCAGSLSREEALEILGLEDGVSDEEIEAAYKRLIKKVHPDQEGSEWMASKLNAARDVLLPSSCQENGDEPEPRP